MLYKHQYLFLLALLSLLCNFAYGQENDNRIDSKQSFDISMLGNKGFLSIGFNKNLGTLKRFTIQLNPAIGYVPGSSEDSLHSSPRFVHLNVGTNIIYGQSLNKVSVGISYTKIVLGDPYKARPKSSYDRILGDISIMHHFKHEPIAIKLSFTPILYDNGADDVDNIPIGIAFRVML